MSPQSLQIFGAHTATTPESDQKKQTRDAHISTVANTYALTALSNIASTTLEYGVVNRIITTDNSPMKRWGRMMVVGVLLIVVTWIILLATHTDWRKGILGINIGAVVGGVRTTDVADIDSADEMKLY